MSDVIRLALADDQALVRMGLKALLGSFNHLQVVIEAENGGAIAAGFIQQRDRCDLVRYPHAGHGRVWPARKIARTRYPDTGYFTDHLRRTGFSPAGGGDRSAGFFAERCLAGRPGRRDRTRGKRGNPSWYRPRRCAHALPIAMCRSRPILSMTARYRFCVCWPVVTRTRKLRKRFLSEGTVKNYVSDILDKLGTRDRTRAVLKAINF